MGKQQAAAACIERREQQVRTFRESSTPTPAVTRTTAAKPSQSPSYGYRWSGPGKPEVEDRVLLPENYVSALRHGPGPFPGTVTELGTTYTGPSVRSSPGPLHPATDRLNAQPPGVLEHGVARGDERVLDLGCGGGEQLLRALTADPQLHAEGVDISVGATHAFGGLLPTLAAAREHLAPGESLLIGEGFWEREPSQDAIEMLGDFTDLAATLDRVVADGWTAVHGYVSTRRELDDYEWACWRSLASWGPGPPGRPGQLSGT